MYRSSRHRTSRRSLCRRQVAPHAERRGHDAQVPRRHAGSHAVRALDRRHLAPLDETPLTPTSSRGRVFVGRVPAAFGAVRRRTTWPLAPADLFDQGDNSSERMGPRFRLDADGRLVGDDPRFAADLPGYGAWRIDGDGRIIEGIAEATASITKIFSGALSDRLGKRKWLAAAGLRSGGFHEAGVSAGGRPSSGWWRRASSTGSAGHSRRPARPLVADLSRPNCAREFWLTPIARHGRRLHGPPLPHRPDVWTSDNFKAVFWFASFPPPGGWR